MPAACLIVDADGKRVQCFHRTADHERLLHDDFGDEACELRSSGFSIALAGFFKGLD